MTTPDNTPSGDCADVTITGSQAASLVELLEHCEQFLRTAGPVVRTELHSFLTGHPTQPAADWLIDMLGFNALYLKGKLPHTHNTDHTADSVSALTNQTGVQA
jgi:hypothetical protein